jgi:hypothetical protein
MLTTPNSTFNRILQNISHVATYTKKYLGKQSREAQNHNIQFNTVDIVREDTIKISLQTCNLNAGVLRCDLTAA